MPPRKRVKQAKRVIFIFCEGESEQEYAKFLKTEYSDVVAIQPPVKGDFEEVRRKFKREPRYRNSIDLTDEMWFFFDTEEDDSKAWDEQIAIIDELSKLRKKPSIQIRLLLTKGCVEYWFLLHFQKTNMPIRSKRDKEKVEAELRKEVSNYKKGNADSIRLIAQKRLDAASNGAWSLKQIEAFGLPSTEECERRWKWLYNTSYTFTNVHEAIDYLESLRKTV